MVGKTLRIVVDDGTDGGTIEGIPSEAWDRFRAAAKLQFPDAGEDAWARFLSEVVIAGAGGDDKLVTYFMTGVPIQYAQAVHTLLENVQFTWDKFHAYLLHASIIPDNVRMVRFHNDEQKNTGVFMAFGLDKNAFAKVEDATGRSFETVMATLLGAAAVGTLTFSPETTFLEPTTKTN